jgi:hypothetical protein
MKFLDDLRYLPWMLGAKTVLLFQQEEEKK